MPTPTGLLRAGDKLTFQGRDTYVVLERTFSSAPYSVWIKHEDGRKFSGAVRRENLRNNGTEFRLMIETGQLPPGWRLWTIMDVPLSQAKKPEPAPKQRLRHIRVGPGKFSHLGPEHAVDIVIRQNDAQNGLLSLSEDELMDLAIRALTYIRDKADGTLS